MLAMVLWFTAGNEVKSQAMDIVTKGKLNGIVTTNIKTSVLKHFTILQKYLMR